MPAPVSVIVRALTITAIIAVISFLFSHTVNGAVLALLFVGSLVIGSVSEFLRRKQ